MKFDPSEITNPRRTLARREAEAESPVQEAAEVPAKPGMSQADFFKKGPAVDPKVKQRKLMEKLRQRGDM